MKSYNQCHYVCMYVHACMHACIHTYKAINSKETYRPQLPQPPPPRAPSPPRDHMPTANRAAPRRCCPHRTTHAGPKAARVQPGQVVEQPSRRHRARAHARRVAGGRRPAITKRNDQRAVVRSSRSGHVRPRWHLMTRPCMEACVPTNRGHAAKVIGREFEWVSWLWVSVGLCLSVLWYISQPKLILDPLKYIYIPPLGTEGHV